MGPATTTPPPVVASGIAEAENCTCGMVNYQDYNSSSMMVMKNEIPWQCGLMSAQMGPIYCGCSIITTNYLLTSAHCVFGETAQSLMATYGATDMMTAKTMKYAINTIKIHPSYDAMTMANDIALLELAAPIDFSDENNNNHIAPICLPPNIYKKLDGKVGMITGYSNVNRGQQASYYLEKDMVGMVKSTKCNKYPGYSNKNSICGKLSCKSDLGAPFITYGDNTMSFKVQAGIMSKAKGCAKPMATGVYTRVSNYVDWIVDEVTGETCPIPDENMEPLPTMPGTTDPTQTTPPMDDDCECGVSSSMMSSRINGGEEVDMHESPWTVGLKANHADQSMMCTGTIISRDWVLTSASCVMNMDVYDLLIVTGEHDINDTDETDKTAYYPASMIKCNPDYNDTTGENDIALVKSMFPFYFKDEVSPICLPPPDDTETYEDFEAEVAGWGETDYMGDTSNTLQIMGTEIISDSDCASTLSMDVSDGMICADSSDGSLPCMYDSGAGLITQVSDTFKVQVGVLGYSGSNCSSDTPTTKVYTKVKEYAGWIASETAGSQMCHPPDVTTASGAPTTTTTTTTTTKKTTTKKTTTKKTTAAKPTYKPDQYLACSSKYVTIPKGSLKRVTSKNYPNEYPKNWSCIWNLKPGRGAKLSVVCYVPGIVCPDSLKIDNKSYCGNKTPKTMANLKSVSISFSSNKSGQGRGFVCNVKAQ